MTDCVNEIRTAERDDWELDLVVFDWIMSEKGFTNNAQCAKALGMDRASLSKIRSGSQRPGGKFITATASIGIPFDVIFKKRVAA